MLKLRLFGGFELTDGAGKRVSLPARKDQALLGYLALGHDPSRDRLASMLWPDRAEPQARKSLRQSLVVLRRALNDAGDVVPSDRRQVLHLASEGLEVDAVRFRELARRQTPEALEEVAALYDGELLPRFQVPAPEFTDWLDGQRRRFADLAYAVFSALAEARLARADWSGAAASARH